MAALSEYANVHNTALHVLYAKGFQVWHDKETDLYCAERGGWDFMAESPTSLLGVVAIYEYRNPSRYAEYWWREEGPADFRNLPSKPKPYKPVWKKNG